MLDALRNTLKLPDLRRRLFFTLLILVIFRLASNIPVPGVDRALLQQQLENRTGGATQLLNLLDLLSGGAVANFSVLAAGVYPYVTASIVLQLLLPIFPKWEQMLKEEGQEGQRKMNQWTFYLTVPLSILQSIGQIRAYSVGGSGAAIIPNFGIGATQLLPTITILMTMMAGTMFAIWLGELITEQGIGNGLSLIIFGGIVSRMPNNLARLYGVGDPLRGIFNIFVFLLIMVAVIFVIVYIQDGERRVKVQYGKRVRGMKVYGGGSTYIPLKVNAVGMIPLIFAQSILAFPAVIASLFLGTTNPTLQAFLNGIVKFFGGQRSGLTDWWMTLGYALLYFLAVVGFTYFYTDVMVQQQNLPEMLQKQGGFIPGVRPGKMTEEFINKAYRRITLVGALFLGGVAVLPYFVEWGMGTTTMLITSSGLLIVVGVVMDTIRQLEAQLSMRHYEGFLE